MDPLYLRWSIDLSRVTIGIPNDEAMRDTVGALKTTSSFDFDHHSWSQKLEKISLMTSPLVITIITRRIGINAIFIIF